MEFDKYLLLHIFSFCDYKSAILFKRINKFFKKELDTDLFWSSWRKLREDKHEASIVYTLYLTDSQDLNVNIGGDIEDIYQMLEHFLYNNKKNSLSSVNLVYSADTPNGDIFNEEIYKSSNLVYEEDCNRVQIYNDYISQDDGYEYDENGHPDYYAKFVDESDPDEFYSICDPRFIHIFKEEAVSCSFDDTPKKMTIKILPDYILGKIFKLANNTNVLYVCKSFTKIYLKETNNPWPKGLDNAASKGYIRYFRIWSDVARSRYDQSVAFHNACVNKHLSIIETIVVSRRPKYKDLIFAFEHYSFDIIEIIVSSSNFSQKKLLKLFKYRDRKM